MPRENASLLRYVLSLDKKYRVPIHLYYYEDYSIEEISRLTQTNSATVGTRLARGRKKRKDMIGEDFYE